MVYVFLADGFEEIEALTPVDVLRRADVEVKTVGVTGKTVTGSHGIPVQADLELSEISLDHALEAVVLPGGMPGTLNLEKNEIVQKAVAFAKKNDILLAAICAAPSILGHLGYLKGKKAISFPGFETALEGATISEAPVCRDGQIITGKGMGVATEFALAIVSALRGRAKAEAVFNTLQCMERCAK